MSEDSSSSSPWLDRLLPPLIDILASSVAGALSTLVGHPLDTIKVRIQIHPHSPKPLPKASAISVLRAIRAKEGVSALLIRSQASSKE